MEKLEQRAALVRSLGYRHEELIGRDELYRLVPALAPHCVGGLLCRADGYARPFHALTAFRNKACSLGVQYLHSTRVERVEQSGGVWRVQSQRGALEAPVLVNCAGAWANFIASMLGEPVPLTPGAPMMMVTERLPRFIDPVVGAASRKLSFKQMQNNLKFHQAHQVLSRAVNKREPVNLTTVAYHFGYFDQAHFIKDFKRYTGMTPGQYLRAHVGPENQYLFYW
jgi:hypothetical protein